MYGVVIETVLYRYRLSQQTLKFYLKHETNNSSWHLITGIKPQIYDYNKTTIVYHRYSSSSHIWKKLVQPEMSFSNY